MKKTISIASAMRVMLMCLIVGLLPALNSCKKDSADISDLVSKVPSSAEAVIGINLGSLLEKAGCKVDGVEITPGENMEGWINANKMLSAKEKESVKMFLSGESGIDPAGAVAFVDAYNSYITAMLADTSKFMEFVKKQTGQEFTETDGVQTCGNVAVAGAQMWVCFSSETSIDAKAIKNYSTLGSEQSFSNNSFAGKISNMSNDITGWGQTKALMRQGMSFSDVATFNVVSSMLFEEATAISFTVDFMKGKLEGRASVLNDKGNPPNISSPPTRSTWQG